MAFKITKDLLADDGATPGTNANAVGVTGPRGVIIDDAKLTHKFRMKDDDGEIYYEGLSSVPDSFQPLECFGEPNAGCTSIEYLKGNKWEAL